MNEEELKKELEQAQALAKAATSAVAKAQARSNTFEKGFNVLAGHLAGHHEAMHKAHAEMHGMLKAKTEAMDDGDEQKGLVGHMAAHHGAVAAEHKSAMDKCASTMKTVEDELKKADGTGLVVVPKADDPNTAAGDAITTMIDKTMAAVLGKALETIAGGGKIEELVEQLVLKRVQEKIGDVTVPTKVRGVFEMDEPGGSAAKVTAVPRPGSAPINVSQVDPEFVDVFGNNG